MTICLDVGIYDCVQCTYLFAHVFLCVCINEVNCQQFSYCRIEQRQKKNNLRMSSGWCCNSTFCHAQVLHQTSYNRYTESFLWIYFISTITFFLLILFLVVVAAFVVANFEFIFFIDAIVVSSSWSLLSSQFPTQKVVIVRF